MCKVGFGMKVLGMSRTSRGSKHVDRYSDRSDMHEALGEADVVGLCLALTPSTGRIIGKAEFEAMKPTSLLVNGARGALIEEAALVGYERGNNRWRRAGLGRVRTSCRGKPTFEPAQLDHNRTCPRGLRMASGKRSETLWLRTSAGSLKTSTYWV